MAFTIQSRLGRGRAVETYRAALDVDGEAFTVVVKRARGGHSRGEELQAALLSWGQRQSTLDHDQVISVLESGRTADGVYVIQEYVAGVSLRDLLGQLRKRSRTLSPALATATALKVAAGLAHLHHGGWVHGALDPGEILLGEDGEVKLGDQELHMLDAYLDPGGDAEAEHMQYRAPELGPADAPTNKSDVFSFGLIFLEMLIGQPIWMAGSMSIAGAISALADFTHVGQAQPELTSRIADFLRNCTAENPTQRYSAVEAHRQLDDLVVASSSGRETADLSVFVGAVKSQDDDNEAPTMMVDPEQAEKLAQDHAKRIAELEGRAVLMDPEMEKKALRGTQVIGSGKSASAITPLPPAPEPSAPQPAPAEVPIAPPTSGSGDLGYDRAPSERRAPPMPPSQRRNVAQNVPDVAKKAQASQAASNEVWRRGMLAAGAILLLVIGLVFAFSGGEGEARDIQLRAGSEPAGAEIYVDGKYVGETPFEETVEVIGPSVDLEFRRPGFRSHKVSIGTQAPELRYEARLESDQPDSGS